MTDETKIAVLEAQLDGVKDNIAKQAGEYERRLMELNHERERYITQATFDTYRAATQAALDAYKLAIEAWRRDVDRWRWIQVGAGLAGGGIAGALMRMVLK